MIHFSPNGGDLLQDTKERHGSAPLAWLFRAVLLLLAAVVECCVSLLMRLLRRSAKVRTAGTAQA